ncbi:MAG: hypothetical protein CVT66_09560 [Actinobacteria bacterium HGW-Actinobacteria-6]|nr:MAG: hypothetical protein CVT66_09560 [Actinobacteria bacterium HGW-Actinobacteria-6]
MRRDRAFSRDSLLTLAAIAVSAAGLAACITLVNLASTVVMELGGFVAIGGPYEIAHPAPGWIVLMPISIVSGFAFGGLSLWASSRVDGYNLIPAVWTGLFVSLGVQFAYFGLRPPGGGGPAWAWIVCAVVFIPMGLAQAKGVVTGTSSFFPKTHAPRDGAYQDKTYRTVYLALVVLGALLGVVGGILLFRAVAG